MNVILHHQAYQRIQQRLDELALPVGVLILDDDGNMTRDGHPIDLDKAAPEGMWFSMDMASSGILGRCFDMVVRSPTIKWMQTFNAGLDNPRYREVEAKGIRVTNSSAQAVAISEYVLAHVLSLYHPIDAQRLAQADKTWRNTPFGELSRSTWLIIGFGHIGQEVARRAKAFDARVLGVRRRDLATPLADRTGTLTDLPDLLPEADIVVLACPHTQETENLADAAFFAALKKDAILVNIARGGLIDDAALLAALDRGDLRAAILDVFRTEPLPKDSPYWEHPGVHVSAHTSYAGNGTIPRGDALFLSNLERYVGGQPLLNEVEKV
jgi:phosphoglycerate dehydrogenase-like enzyme